MVNESFSNPAIAFLLVFMGGGLGASIRHYLYSFLNLFSSISFQFSTLVINLIGCFVAGLIFTQLTEMPKIKLFAITGLLGGFTTYSLFSIDALTLYEQSDIKSMIIYIGVSAIGSCIAAYLGFQLSKIF